MIRKAIIILLTLGAVGMGTLSVLSFREAIILRGSPASYRFTGDIGWGVPAPIWSVENGTLQLEFVRCLGQAYDPRAHRFERVNLLVARLVLVDNMFLSMPDGWVRIDRLFLPLWTPLLIFATYPTLAFIRGPVRRWRRRRRGLCVKCAYNLTGNVSGVCPECGVRLATRRVSKGRTP